MTFDATETSVQDGDLAELLSFTRNDNVIGSYTSSETDYIDTTVSPNVTYSSANIATDPIATTVERARIAQNLIVPRNFAIAELYRVASPTDTISLTIYWVHRGDGQKAAVWFGRIMDVVFDNASAGIHCEPIHTSLREPGLDRVYGVNCPHDLYGVGCNLDKGNFVTNTVASGISGRTITVGELGDFSDYVGGFVEWVDANGNTERRYIEGWSGPTGSPAQNVLTLNIAFNGLSVTSPLQSVAVYPGCARNTTVCDGDFNNLPNYGGQPLWPDKDLFGGEPVF